MPTRRPTIRDVATLAGASTATVSNVFSGRKPVAAALRERVEAAARTLGYQLDRAASQLRSGQARIIGVLVPDLDDAFFTALVSRLEVMAGKDGYDVIIASSRDDPALERSRLKALCGWRPSGLIAVPCSDRVPELLLREAARLPVVLADRVVPAAAPADVVVIDNAEAGEIAARHLVAAGHREVAIAASSLAFAPIRERLRGAEAHLRAATGCAPVTIELGANSEAGARAFAYWLERHSRPSAVFALTNVTTLAVLTALAAARVEMPGQISVIGFDDYAWMSARRTALTAIRQPLDAMAEAIWARLTARIAGERGPPVVTCLNTTLMVRDSVRTLPGPGAAAGVAAAAARAPNGADAPPAQRGRGQPRGATRSEGGADAEPPAP
ncbi:MAG: LacI family DNA-binding transcriptional regulator [Rhodobacteraceae bacterium]|nr:LacI family DNA-binding transcriptional regulator [Paracoccaceae bacterium]